jgi:hypothetical protein
MMHINLKLYRHKQIRILLLLLTMACLLTGHDSILAHASVRNGTVSVVSSMPETPLSVSFDPAILEEGTNLLSNPYRGFYRMVGYRLTDSWNGSSADIAETVSQDETIRLALLQINLRNYRDGAISETGLSQLQAILEAWSGSGNALILRFLYDWDGRAKETEPDSLTTVYRHMDQVAPIINQFKENIYLLQGVFLGDCGEMHGSSLTAGKVSTDVYRSLLEYFAAITDPSIFLSVRTPAQLRAVTLSRLPLSRASSYDGTLAARLGLFNDGMLGSSIDLGTYAPYNSHPVGLSGAGLRTTELYFQNLLCRYVPNGGEVVLDNPYNDLPSALSDLSAMHVTYLNIDHDQSVLEKWKNTPYTGEGPFRDQDGFTYIQAHLGYRYIIRSSSLTPAADSAPTNTTSAANTTVTTITNAANTTITTVTNTASTTVTTSTNATNTTVTTANNAATAYTLTTTIENTGFAPCYRPLEVHITLTPKNSASDPITLPIPTDTRYWNSGDTVTLTVPLDVAAYPPDSYTISLHISDPLTAEPITCANTTSTPTGGTPLGTLTIS